MKIIATPSNRVERLVTALAAYSPMRVLDALDIQYDRIVRTDYEVFPSRSFDLALIVCPWRRHRNKAARAEVCNHLDFDRGDCLYCWCAWCARTGDVLDLVAHAFGLTCEREHFPRVLTLADRVLAQLSGGAS